MAARTFKAVACYLSEAQIQRLKAVGARLDRPMAWCIRAAVDAYIKNQGGRK